MIELEMLPEDIQLGTKGDPSWCPIARCLKRYFTSKHINFGLLDVYVEDGDLEINFDLIVEKDEDYSTYMLDVGNVEELENFIEQFDAGNEVNPIKIQLYEDQIKELTDAS